MCQLEVATFIRHLAQCSMFESLYLLNGKVESTLKLVLNPEEPTCVEAKVLSAQPSRSREVSKEFLQKLWLVPEHLAKSTIQINAQILSQSKDHALYLNNTTNDRMLR